MVLILSHRLEDMEVPTTDNSYSTKASAEESTNWKVGKSGWMVTGSKGGPFFWTKQPLLPPIWNPTPSIIPPNCLPSNSSSDPNWEREMNCGRRKPSSLPSHAYSISHVFPMSWLSKFKKKGSDPQHKQGKEKHRTKNQKTTQEEQITEQMIRVKDRCKQVWARKNRFC